MSDYQKSELAGGLRVVTESVPGARSTALGLWVEAGSIDEGDDETGLAHLIEHMVFKGTEKRSTFDIAKEGDLLGGLTNAYTSKDLTCFHTVVMAEHLPRAVNLLWDIFQNSVFDAAELEKEKDVVYQEIAMLEDSPEEFIHDFLPLRVYPDHPFGRPITGDYESVAALGRPQIFKYLENNYQPNRVVLAAAGQVEHERLLDILAGCRFETPYHPRDERPTPPARQSGLWLENKKLEQAHLLFDLDFPVAPSPERHAAALLSDILGGAASSRLFQEIRERRGLAYSVYSYYNAYQAAGSLSVYAGAAPDKIAEVARVVLDELGRLCREPAGAAELADAKEHLAAATVLGAESLESRMGRLARNEIIFGRQWGLEETLAAVRAVRAEEIRSLAERSWGGGDLAACVLGPVKRFAFNDFPLPLR